MFYAYLKGNQNLDLSMHVIPARMKFIEKPFTIKAFTLIELLVTVAVIGILASILLPALNTAKIKATTTACLNNKKQLSVALGLYTFDNDDWLPMNSHFSERLMRSDGTFIPNWVSGNLTWDINSDNTNVEKVVAKEWSSLSSMLGSQSIPFSCPSDRYLSAPQKQLGWTRRIRSVSMNYLVGPGLEYGTSKRDPLPPGLKLFERMSQFKRKATSDIITFLDEHPDSIYDPVFEIPLEIPTEPEFPGAFWPSLPGSNHGGATFAFADGHVEIKKWNAEYTKQNVLYSRWKHLPPNDPKVRDKRDFIWMSSHFFEWQ